MLRDPHLTAMGMDNGADQGQTQAGAAGSGRASPLPGIEDVLALIQAYTRTPIRDRDHDFGWIVTGLSGDDNRASAVDQGIVE